MSEAEAREFGAAPYVREAVRLRQWDDQAKVVGWKTPGLLAYRVFLEKWVERDVVR